MRRLIDADKLIKRIKQEPTDGMFTDEILQVINDQPTAYDVDNVMEKIHNARTDVLVNENDGTEEAFNKAVAKLEAYDKAIEIVKDGGVNG